MLTIFLGDCFYSVELDSSLDVGGLVTILAGLSRMSDTLLAAIACAKPGEQLALDLVDGVEHRMRLAHAADRSVDDDALAVSSDGDAQHVRFRVFSQAGTAPRERSQSGCEHGLSGCAPAALEVA